MGGCGWFVVARAHAAEPHIDTAPRPLGGTTHPSDNVPSIRIRHLDLHMTGTGGRRIPGTRPRKVVSVLEEMRIRSLGVIDDALVEL